MNDDKIGGERRIIQRDWLGHCLQLAGMLLVVGIPLLIWGININTTIAIMANAIAHHDKDITEMRQIQSLVTNQIIDVNKVLIRIDTQLEGIRDQGKIKR